MGTTLDILRPSRERRGRVLSIGISGRSECGQKRQGNGRAELGGRVTAVTGFVDLYRVNEDRNSYPGDSASGRQKRTIPLGLCSLERCCCGLICVVNWAEHR